MFWKKKNSLKISNLKNDLKSKAATFSSGGVVENKKKKHAEVDGEELNIII